mmetsp:Transcript_18172/g.39615  ORF Transcript_18172/g.39615 Transcript_18172/m.39615 type:complete len:104 (+) Transcript_18172:1588-1899(+)
MLCCFLVACLREVQYSRLPCDTPPPLSKEKYTTYSRLHVRYDTIRTHEIIIEEIRTVPFHPRIRDRNSNRKLRPTPAVSDASDTSSIDSVLGSDKIEIHQSPK